MKKYIYKRLAMIVLAIILCFGNSFAVFAQVPVADAVQKNAPAGMLQGIDISESGVEKSILSEEEFLRTFHLEEEDIQASEEEMHRELMMKEAGGEVSENSISANGVGVLPEKATYATTEDAADYVRSRMVKRKKTATIRVVSSYGALAQNISAIMTDVFAYDVNGKPYEGDYLYWHMAGYGLLETPDKNSDGTYTVCLGFLYRSTLENENYVTARVNSIISQLNLRSPSLNEYQKVRIIYDYVMSIITYDYHHYEYQRDYDPMYTTFGALDSGQAVCQAYATLFYRLSEEAGLSARVICGNDEGGVPTHGWNIVKIGNVYYNLDATWDDSDSPTHRYFLKNMTDFIGHQRNARHVNAEFERCFPTASLSYRLPEETMVTGQGVVGALTVKQTKNNSVTLSWGAYAGATDYLIYRRSGAGQYYCVGNTKTTTYTDEIISGQSYVYRVYAMYGNSEMAKSGEVGLNAAVMLLQKGKTYTVGEYKYKVLKSTATAKTVAFSGVTKKSAMVRIPDTITIDGLEYTVTEISAGAFKGNKKVKTVSIGANVTKIGNKAFYKAKKLTNIVVRGKKLKTVGKSALSGISSKAVIRVPSSKLKKYKKIFKGKGQKSSVKIKK